MRTLRNHLKIVFGEIQPEMLIKNIQYRFFQRAGKGDADAPLFSICGRGIDREAYIHYSRSLFRDLTYEEVNARYSDMSAVIEQRGKTCGGTSVFALLPEYTCHVLKENGEGPICKQEQFLNWRRCYLALGQDLLTTAHLAYKSFRENRIITDFSWPAMVETDDRRLMYIVDKGLAENHFHLNGSTRVFDLSWLCLMNHPDQISRFFGGKEKKWGGEQLNDLFKENLNDSVSNGENDNSLSWAKRLNIACWLRVQLFEWLGNGTYRPYFEDEESTNDEKSPKRDLCRFINALAYASNSRLCDLVETVRFISSKSGKTRNDEYRRVDYAISANIAKALSSDSATRYLSGERAFLYSALYRIYSGEISGDRSLQDFSDLFYLYILIKMKFRNELIQVNNRYGFKNFAQYQDRKDFIFDEFPEYDYEAKNLSVNDSIKKGHVSSLELRVVTRSSASDQYCKIFQTDRDIWRLSEGEPVNKRFDKKFVESAPYFYVLHFPKQPEDLSKKPKYLSENKKISDIFYSIYGIPRNNDVRKSSELQAKELAKALEHSGWLCSRIRGIDACNFEIGCRPEVFATEFRFLRSLVSQRSKDDFASGTFPGAKLYTTYHVGEDFMDILDGLRAIDETLAFLEMESGDRLGHAMALGVNPRHYYKLKNNVILLPGQDYLDNIVWALNKSRELNISLGGALTQQLCIEAQHLINKIYGSGYSIQDYYNSLRLRGDSPELYRYGFFDEDEYKYASRYGESDLISKYNFCRIRKRYHMDELEDFRKNSQAARLYWLYHFSSDVKMKGSVMEQRKVLEPYINMVEALQDGMQREVVRLRIGIECNLSSNVLIGPFNRYEQHPIFRFYPVVPNCDDALQFVSINTDDQGVFDTSLETEYALLVCALRSVKNENGSAKYNDDEIYSYVERIRENGFAQMFTSAKQQFALDKTRFVVV